MSSPDIKKRIGCRNAEQIEKDPRACSSPGYGEAASAAGESKAASAARCEARIAETLSVLAAVAAVLRSFTSRPERKPHGRAPSRAASTTRRRT